MRSLKNQFGSCTRSQWVLGSGLVAIAISFYLFYYRPSTRQLAQMQAEITQGQERLRTNQGTTSALAVLRQEVVRTKARIEKFDKKLPHTEEGGQFISDINRNSRELSLKKISVIPWGAQKMDRLYEKPYAIRFEGDFLNAAMFIRQLEDLQRLTRLRKLSIKARDSKLGQVEVELVTSIYFTEG